MNICVPHVEFRKIVSVQSAVHIGYITGFESDFGIFEMWLTAPNGTIMVNWTSVTNWQMVGLRDNVISIRLNHVY